MKQFVVIIGGETTHRRCLVTVCESTEVLNCNMLNAPMQKPIQFSKELSRILTVAGDSVSKSSIVILEAVETFRNGKA